MRHFLPLLLLGAFALVARADEAPLDPAAQRAHAVFEKQLAKEPDSAAVHFAYGEFLAGRGELRAAVVQRRLAPTLEPGNAAVANLLGGIYLRMGRVAQSAAQFRRAIESGKPGRGLPLQSRERRISPPARSHGRLAERHRAPAAAGARGVSRGQPVIA